MASIIYINSCTPRFLSHSPRGDFQVICGMTKLQACAGLFGLLPLPPEQILRLKEEFGIYILSNGRINFTGIMEENVEYIVESLKLVLI